MTITTFYQLTIQIGLVKREANFYPPKNKSKELETNISFINNIDIANQKSNKTGNFSPKKMDRVKKSDELAYYGNQRSR